jgi:CARDB
VGALTVPYGVAAAAAPPRADLVALGVAVSKTMVGPGGSLRANVTVKNLGRARARRSRTGLFLSRDRRRGRGDTLLDAPRTSGLGGTSVRLAVAVVVRAGTKAGTYHLVACADLTHLVRELSNRNNCAASNATIMVGPPGGGGSGEGHPPVFAGLEAATTCLPGPIGPPRSSSYRLQWSAAKDDRTPQNEIVYDIYQASSAGGQDFTKPTYTTAPGATSFSTPGLTSAETWHFVVRARDRDGNRDQNKVERIGENLCL